VADGVVNENLMVNFGEEVQVPEARAMYALQAFVEEIHAETYSRLLIAIVGDEEEQSTLLSSHREAGPINVKVRWAEKYMSSTESFACRLLAFACVEGIMFSSSFAAIFYLKYRKVKMPALINSNELISRDEGMHRDFAVLLYKSHVRRKLEEPDVHELIKDAVAVEQSFVLEALGEQGLEGMTTKDMCTYVEKVADHLCISLGYKPIYRVNNPFPWMESICAESKTDRFVKRNTQYRMPGELKLSYGVGGCAANIQEGSVTKDSCIVKDANLELNGVYWADGDMNGKPRYSKDGDCYLYFDDIERSWVLSRGGVSCYSVISNADRPPGGVWAPGKSQESSTSPCIVRRRMSSTEYACVPTSFAAASQHLQEECGG